MPWNLIFAITFILSGSGAAYYLIVSAREMIDAWNFGETRNLALATLAAIVFCNAIIAAAYGLSHLLISP